MEFSTNMSSCVVFQIGGWVMSYQLLTVRARLLRNVIQGLGTSGLL